MSLYVQSTNATAAAANTLSKAFTSNIGTGKRLMLVPFLDYRAGTGAVRTIADTFISSWNLDVVVTLLATIDFGIYSAIAPAAGGANTVTLSYGGVNQTSIIVAPHEYRLMRTASPFDVGHGAVDSTGTSNALNSGNTAATNFANELVFGWGAGAAGTLTAGSNEAFIRRESTAAGFASMDAVKGATGVTSAQFTDSATGDWLCCVATYRRRMEFLADLNGIGSLGCMPLNRGLE